MRCPTRPPFLAALVLALLLALPSLPGPASARARPAPRLIEVNLTTQWLTATDHGHVVFRAPVSTGKPGLATPAGHFTIYAKRREQTLQGCIRGDCWRRPHVPAVMYFTGAVAFHGAYWHHAFGTGRRVSHGCVNLRVADAVWLYTWAPIGTSVWVHY
jgi:lipoprotein-anchoring transpeptidase ErfK/SrfK